MSTSSTTAGSLDMLLRSLRLPSFARYAEDIATQAQQGGWSFGQYLHHLAEIEVQERDTRRIDRLRKVSGLPADKTLATLERSRLTTRVQRALATLAEGDFVSRAENVLAFGLPGRGKTHLACAIGHALVDKGIRVAFTSTVLLIQNLLAARRDLRLEKSLASLDRFEVVILDDIGYVQQSREEMEVLFTFLAARYERRSVIITSNLVFSEWDKIFKDPMTTAAAIDRLVHHCTILEMGGPSYRADQAKERVSSTTTTTTII